MIRPPMAIFQRLLDFHRLPPTSLLTTFITLAGAVFITRLLGWPVWVAAIASLLPWLPYISRGLACASQRSRWLGLAYLLVVVQGGHTIEHVVQMAQIHLLRLTGEAAHGLIGKLDLEWVHFVFNSLILLGVLGLLVAERRGGWLWLTALVAGWHQIEQTYIMMVYLTTDVVGTPGLLARGGLIGGGLPLARPDLHFLYNLIETVPLVLAFIHLLRATRGCALTATVATATRARG